MLFFKQNDQMILTYGRPLLFFVLCVDQNNL